MSHFKLVPSQCAYIRPLKIFKMVDMSHGVAAIMLFWLSQTTVCLYSVAAVPSAVIFVHHITNHTRQIFTVCKHMLN